MKEHSIGQYADLLNDIAFQWVFGQESNKDLLLLLLNEFIPDKAISDVTLYKQRQLSFSKGFKKGVFDVSCITDDGSYIDVEVQVRKQAWFADRCLYYSTFSLQSQVSEGVDEYCLKPVYVVSIDDFSRGHGPDWGSRVLSSYSIREDENHELMTDSLHFVFVELSYFKKQWKDIDNDKERLYFCLKHLHEMDELPECFAEGIWSKLANQARVVEMEPEVKEQYIRAMETEIDKRAQMKYALSEATRIGREEGLSKGLEEGRAKGLEEGRAKGLEEGRAKGLEEGRAESAAEIARRMKSLGIPESTVCDVTGLPLDTITAL